MFKKLIFVVGLLSAVSGYSQGKKLTEKDYVQSPHWISMMDIEGVDFNETVKAYVIYWQHHEMPEEEGDRVLQKGDAGKKISKKELKAIREGAAMRFQIKKFQHWKIINENFVKENGHIMTAEEKLKFHNQHQ
jgi:hypothetical protein